MTTTTAAATPGQSPVRPTTALFAVTVFASAALVFLVEPMVAKLVLPLLGGSSSVWNTSLAFFQTALLVGYAYAHALQRVKSLKTQALIHCGALAIAALALPLRISELFGPPSSVHPNLWLIGVLTASIGAPFAVLSATAPMVQAWHARTLGAIEGKEPYALYAASNLGSLLALLAYPLIVEPTLTVHVQTLGWSLIYAAFVLLIGVLALRVARAASAPAAAPAASPAAARRVTWRDRFAWVGLAAIPSSLMLGVTTYITTDIASAPFLWVIPLALYLGTFIIAFQTKPAIPPRITLLLQAIAICLCVPLLPYRTAFFLLQLVVHLGAFFLTALMCHQALVARRPDPARLTEFYLWMSVGGVVGGGFNAFLAPVIFDNVWEYPLVLALGCLARPWGGRKIGRDEIVQLAVTVLVVAMVPVIQKFVAPYMLESPAIGPFSQSDLARMVVWLNLGIAMIIAFMMRGRGVLMFVVIAGLSFSANRAADEVNTTQTWRSFFGVLRQSQTIISPLGQVRMLAHGTTLHGGQALKPLFACNPLVYYAVTTPIGQVFSAMQREHPTVRVGAVGLGTGSVAAYTRPGDHLTFFEIDPLVIKISSDPSHFSYTTHCARGKVDYVLGDARLTVAKQPKAAFDILLIDAFSSDAVPAHLLTAEAVRGYLTHLKPDGVLILHLSNRNLDLKGPALAVARAAGGVSMLQSYEPRPEDSANWASSEDAVIIGRSDLALARFMVDRRWTRPTTTVRPWTDDYTNLFGALVRRMKERIARGEIG